MSESVINSNAAIVLFSGGQDSTTCLAWALERFEHVETVGFDYGQRHRIELDVRPRVIESLKTAFPAWAAKLGEDHMVELAALGQVSDTALTRDVGIVMTQNGLPSTFVPGRNLVFLTFAAAIAYRRGAKHIVTGVCETDYSGYPDCRDDTVKAMQIALNLGMETRFVIHTPLDVDRQGGDLGNGGGSRRRQLHPSDQRRDAHLLPRGQGEPPSLGPGLRNLSRMRIESRRLAAVQ